MTCSAGFVSSSPMTSAIKSQGSQDSRVPSSSLLSPRTDTETASLHNFPSRFPFAANRPLPSPRVFPLSTLHSVAPKRWPFSTAWGDLSISLVVGSTAVRIASRIRLNRAPGGSGRFYVKGVDKVSMCSVDKIRDRVEKGGKDKRTGRNKRMKSEREERQGKREWVTSLQRYAPSRPKQKPRARLAPRNLRLLFFFFFTLPTYRKKNK